MKYLILLLLMIGFVSAECININSANLNELDEIIWVGPATAQKIIDARPFDSLDDLIKIVGIGEVKVSDIKNEGLACVDNDIIEKTISKDVRHNIISKEDVEEEFLSKDISPKTILLNNGTSENIEKIVYESKNAKVIKWLPYGFSLFLIFIIGVLLWERF